MTIAVSDSLLAVRFGATTVADLDDLMRAQQEVVKKHGHVTMISLVPTGDTTSKVTDEVKAKSVELTKAVGKNQIGSATVILGKGLGATVIRTFMTGFNLLAKNPFPTKTFSDVGEALVWLSALPNQSADVKKASATEILGLLKLAAAAKAA